MGNLFGLFSKQFSPLRFGKFEKFYGIGGVYVHGVSLARPKPRLGDNEEDNKEASGLELYFSVACGSNGLERRGNNIKLGLYFGPTGCHQHNYGKGALC